MKKTRSLYKHVVLISVAVGLIGGSMPGTALALNEGQQRNKALELLQKYSGKAHRGAQKLIACLRGADTCTEKEIKNTRTYVGIISAALALLVVGGTAASIWQWRRGKGVPMSSDVARFIEQIKTTSDGDLLMLDWNMSHKGHLIVREWVSANWASLPKEVQDRLERTFVEIDRRSGERQPDPTTPPVVPQEFSLPQDDLKEEVVPLVVLQQPPKHSMLIRLEKDTKEEVAGWSQTDLQDLKEWAKGAWFRLEGPIKGKIWNLPLEYHPYLDQVELYREGDADKFIEQTDERTLEKIKETPMEANQFSETFSDWVETANLSQDSQKKLRQAGY